MLNAKTLKRQKKGISEEAEHPKDATAAEVKEEPPAVTSEAAAVCIWIITWSFGLLKSFLVVNSVVVNCGDTAWPLGDVVVYEWEHTGWWRMGG